MVIENNVIERLESLIKTDRSVEFVTCTANAEQIVGFCAKVSNPSNQLSDSTKLLAYCIKHEHWSVFETASMTVQIKTSRAIGAQILRHRSFTFQEFSQRYALASNMVKYPARRQDNKNRQNSIDDMSQEDKDWFDEQQDEIWNRSKMAYDEAIARGVAKEQARFLLPLNTETTIYMSGNVRNWLHYIQLRTKPGTQLEHLQIAEECKTVFSEHFPDIAKAMEWIDEKVA